MFDRLVIEFEFFSDSGKGDGGFVSTFVDQRMVELVFESFLNQVFDKRLNLQSPSVAESVDRTLESNRNPCIDDHCFHCFHNKAKENKSKRLVLRDGTVQKMVSRSKLVQELCELGVVPKPLMVHASLREVGAIEGGGDTLIQALLEVLGARGTMLMVLDADPDKPFDALTTPVDVEDMGVLAELFRNTPGAIVNDHVAARFAALGPQAKELLDPIPLHDYFGPSSIFERFTQLEGSVLRLGADIDTVTLTHYAEYLAQLPEKRRVRRRLLRADIGEQYVESLDDTNGIVDWLEGDYFSQILIDFLNAGNAKTGPVGHCVAELFEARRFVPFAVRWMEKHLR